MTTPSKTLLLGLGNPILMDDGIGWRVTDALAARLPAGCYDVLNESGATLDLLHKFEPYDRLVVVDAVQNGKDPVGTVQRFCLADLEPTTRHSSPHDVNFISGFSVARQWGYRLPEEVVIYGIEVRELRRFGEALTPELEARLESIVEEIRQDLERDAGAV